MQGLISCFHSSEVQTILVRSSWGQLFTLGLAQCAHTLSLPSILTSIINHLQASIAQEKITASKVKLVTEHICRLQDCVSSLHKLQVDATEFAYLKALTLFSAGKKSIGKHFINFGHVYVFWTLPSSGIISDNVISGVWRKKVEVLQEAAWNELQRCVGSERLPRLLMRLPPLRSIDPRVLEDLFFAGLIGRVSVASVVPYILTMPDCKTEPEGHMGWPCRLFRKHYLRIEGRRHPTASLLSGINITSCKRLCSSWEGG